MDLIPDQVKDIGYDSHNGIANLKSLALFFLLYTIKLMCLPVIGILNFSMNGRN